MKLIFENDVNRRAVRVATNPHLSLDVPRSPLGEALGVVVSGRQHRGAHTKRETARRIPLAQGSAWLPGIIILARNGQLSAVDVFGGNCYCESESS